MEERIGEHTVNWRRRQDFPTPVSPIMMYLKRKAYAILTPREGLRVCAKGFLKTQELERKKPSARSLEGFEAFKKKCEWRALVSMGLTVLNGDDDQQTTIQLHNLTAQAQWGLFNCNLEPYVFSSLGPTTPPHNPSTDTPYPPPPSLPTLVTAAQ